MRFLAVQEDGYGVGLVQDRLPDYADESMMAATGDTEPDDLPRIEEGSMISNLPLLFANGYPTSLEKISLKQLERFITFMVQCSLGHDTAEVISQPKWWPKEVKFSNPLVRPKKINDSWMANLKKLVFRCYTYHRSDYLLEFCTKLAINPQDELYYVNNWDSTTSLYHKVTGKLLVTFRNENMNYDRPVESPRRCLLPQHGGSSSFASKSKQPQQKQQTRSLMVIQPPSDEIYLCDNCDAEFVGLEKMKDHEKTCGEHMQTASGSRSQTPNEPSLQDEELPQNQFLEYFSLYSEVPPSCKSSGKSVTCNPMIIDDHRASRRVRGSVNLTRCPSIPFSSPAGLAMAKKAKMMTEVTQQERLDRIERHMHAPALGRSVRPKWLDRLVEYNRWVVTFKPNRDKPIGEEQQQQHTHEYKFNSRRDKPVLSIRSQLLYITCKPIYVALERPSPEALAELKRDPSKYLCPPRRIMPKIRPRPRPKSLLKSRPGFSLMRKLSIEHFRVNPIEEGENEKDETIIEKTERCENLNNELDDDLAEITVIRESPGPILSKNLQTGTLKKNIVLVDLCSSDEEIENPRVSSDENRDPMSEFSCARTSFVKNQTVNKYRSKSCVHPADSTSDWLRDNVLTDDNDKFGNKCLNNVVLETCTQFSPILKPAP